MSQPDLLTLADVATLLGITEQNVRRRLRNHRKDPDQFPLPVDGDLWQQSDIMQYAQRRYARKFQRVPTPLPSPTPTEAPHQECR